MQVAASWRSLVQLGVVGCTLEQTSHFGADCCSLVQLGALWYNVRKIGALWYNVVELVGDWCTLVQLGAL